MMQAIKQSGGVKPKWYFMCATVSSSSSWAFDRLRLYNPSSITEVALFGTEPTGVEDENGNTVLTNAPTSAIQKFSTTNSFEHDFTFDLSFNTAKEVVYVGIRGIPTTANWQQVYCYPTGFGGTRNKNAEISIFALGLINPDTNGTEIGRLRFEYQPLSGYLPMNLTDVNAKEVRLNNATIGLGILNSFFDMLVSRGHTNGTFDYTGHTPGNNGRLAAYNTLISRGWTIIGPAPTS